MYSGVSGMRGFQTKLDVIGNNIANVNTVGYKKSRVMFEDLLSQNMAGSSVNSKQVGLGSTVAAIDTLHTAGSPMTTGIQTDLSIQGEGYFAVKDGNDNYLVRSAAFQVDQDGNLVNSQGLSVIDNKNNPITGISKVISIDGSGNLTYLNGAGTQQTATLKSGTVPNPSGLEKMGGSLYKLTDESGVTNINNLNALPNDSRIISGQLEMSNVDLTEEFTEMIVAQRGFQANSRVITTSDEILQEIVNLKR